MNVDETEWIVVRPEGHIAGSPLASAFEGQWLKRAELVTGDHLALAGPAGEVRAYPTGEAETDAAGDVAEVWRVAGDTGADPGEVGLDNPDGLDGDQLRRQAAD